MSLGVGVIGCGSVFAGPYRKMIDRLRRAGRVHVSAVYDVDDAKRRAAAAHYEVDADLRGPADVVGADDVDIVLVLTSMNEHGPLARAALEAGRHVLVEKPMATSLAEAEELIELDRTSPGLLICAPHILLSPTFRAVHAAVREGQVGDLLTARARYGWAGPWWNEWFYAPGGGSLFDLGVYNVTSLCDLFGPARRVTAMVGVAIPEREVNGRRIRVEADDNAHVLLDFGDARFAVVTTGFTMQRYRSPAIEAYGTEGTIQLLGEDWAPEGWELWRNARGGCILPPTRTGSGPRGCDTSSTASRPDGLRSRGPSTPTTRSRSHSPRKPRAATGSPGLSRATFPIPSTTPRSQSSTPSG